LTIVMVCSSGILAVEESVTRGMTGWKRADRQLEWRREDEDEERCKVTCKVTVRAQGGKRYHQVGAGAGVASSTSLNPGPKSQRFWAWKGRLGPWPPFCRSAMVLHTAILTVFWSLPRALSRDHSLFRHEYLTGRMQQEDAMRSMQHPRAINGPRRDGRGQSPTSQTQPSALHMGNLTCHPPP
jgi:hypothetical protein